MRDGRFRRATPTRQITQKMLRSPRSNRRSLAACRSARGPRRALRAERTSGQACPGPASGEAHSGAIHTGDLARVAEDERVAFAVPGSARGNVGGTVACGTTEDRLVGGPAIDRRRGRLAREPRTKATAVEVREPVGD